MRHIVLALWPVLVLVFTALNVRRGKKNTHVQSV